MALNFEDLREIGRAEMVTRRPDLAAVLGDASEMAVTAGAAMADAAVGLAAKGVRDTYLDGAQGDALTTLVSDRYGLDRFEATQAQGSVQFTRTSGGGGLTIPAGTRVATNPDSAGKFQTFTTDIDLVFGAGVNGPLSVNATCVLGGKDGNVAPSKILRILDTLSDPTFTVNNSAVFVGGSEQESDDALRERARAFYKTLRRGTKEALEFGALQVPTVKRATAVEDAAQIVTVYVSDIDGASNAQMVADVQAELDTGSFGGQGAWRALGSCAHVDGGVLFTQVVTLSLAVRTGVDATALVDSVRSAVSARIERLKIGETLFRSMILQAVLNVNPDAIVNATISVPAADVVPSSNQLIRSPTGVITVS